MLKWVGNLFLAITLLMATDLQWLVMQSVAWTGMIMSYSHRAPFKVALMETFDGKHPCSLCKAIASTKRSEKQKEFTLQVRKLEFPPAPENFALVAPSRFRILPLKNTFAETLPQPPLTPPPRDRSASFCCLTGIPGVVSD